MKALRSQIVTSNDKKTGSKVLSTNIIKTDDYKRFIQDIKQCIQSAQIKAAVAVNQELLRLYWDLAKRMVAKQKETAWGDGFIKQMSIDLQAEFPDMKGFSERNLKYIRQWYLFCKRCDTIGQQLVAQIPWGHNIVIISKCKSTLEAVFYVQKTIQNNWSRAVLTHHIESGLYAREGKAITNFKTTLPKPQSDLARQTLKDPYNFDFLMLREKHDEKELEDALINHVTRFLLELGAGFSYIGRQFRLEVDGDEFFIDLLFYHVRLHCYVVIELKTAKFKPEFAGKLNFYISAVDGILKTEQDNSTIGILICKSKNDTVERKQLEHKLKADEKFKKIFSAIEAKEIKLKDGYRGSGNAGEFEEGEAGMSAQSKIDKDYSALLKEIWNLSVNGICLQKETIQGKIS